MLRITRQAVFALAIALTANALASTVHAGGRSGGTVSDCPSCQNGGAGRVGIGGRARGNDRYTVQQRISDTHEPDLFYNYYVPPQFGGVGAQLYMAPHPVPSHVGHTYYTYQPLYPHEYLYHHSRSYHRYYDCGRGLHRTKVHYGSVPGSGVAGVLYNCLRLPR